MGGDEKGVEARLAVESAKLSASLAEARALAARLAEANAALAAEQQRTLDLRRRLDALVALMKAGTFHWHAPTDGLECDQNAAALFGIAPSDHVLLADLLRRLDCEDAEAMQLHWKRCVDDAIPFHVDVRVPEASGATRWIGILGRGCACEDSGPHCVVGACADTTALHHVAEADEIRRVADTIPQLVWIAAPDGRLEYTNDRWLEYTGHAPPPHEVTRLIDAFVEEDRLRVRERWLGTIHGGHELEMEARLVGHDGKARWFLLRALPMIGADGVIVRWAGTCTDIDAQKRSELDLSAARDARDRAIATLGHELRTPLTTITMTLDLMHERSPASERDCAAISRQVQRMSRMIEDMLDLTRVAGGRVALQRRPTNVSSVLADAIEACAAQLRERSLVTALDPHLIVDGEPDRLHQVFVNLLSNAAKYTLPRGHITVRAGRWEEDIFVEVRDDGIGMTPEVQAHIFEPYVQAKTSSKRQGGLGLGLSIARSLVELHGGTISVASEGPQQGSTFVVRLPASAIAPIRRSAVLVEAPSAGRCRVLVVDDSPDVTEMLADLLRLEGHDVMVAHDARSALELAISSPPDVALIDFHMPDMDGGGLARQLRTRLGDRCPRLIAVSGFDSPVDRGASLGVFERWLTKPFDVHLVRAVVAGPRRRRRRRASTRPKRGT